MALRTRFDPLPTLNPRRLVQYLQQFEHGYLDPAARTWEAMERRDDRLASVSAKAKSALARYGFEVRVRGDVPVAQREEAAKHQAALEYLYTHCTVTNAAREDETGGFSLLVRQMADAIGKRYSVHEIVWEPGAGGQQLTATFRHAPLWFFEATSGRLRYKLQDGAALGVEMDPAAWLVTVGDGIMEACSVLWVYKHLPLRDWLAYSEKFGLPYLLGKTQAIYNSAEWQAMVSALRGFGNDGAAVVGGSDDIVPVTVGGGSEGTPFPGLVERSERAMSILWRGADLGTQAHSGSGGGQGASLQGDETSALDEDRAAWLSESLASVSRTAIRYLFGEGVPPLAYVRLKTQVARDIQLDLAVDAFLLSNGAPLAVADVLARYNRPTPRADEPLLRPPGSGSGGGSGAGGVKGAASEDATLASIERAANAVAAGVSAGNFNPNHDKLGRFATSEEAGGKDDVDAPTSSPTGEGSASPPATRRQVFVRAADLLPALQSDDPQALQRLHEQYLAHASHPASGQQLVVLALDNPRSWVTPLSDDPNSPWARALPLLTEHDIELAAREVGKLGKGFFVNGPMHLIKGLPSSIYQSTLPAEISAQVQDFRRASANPQGTLAGYAEISRERQQALVAELKHLTTTSDGVGELLFDLSSLFVGDEAVAGLKERILPLQPRWTFVPEMQGPPAEPFSQGPTKPAEPALPARPPNPITAKPGEMQVVDPKRDAVTSELGSALSGIGDNPLGRNLNTLDEFGPGAGFAGVYDVESGKFLAYPSGSTRLLGNRRPLNRVGRGGGHRDVNRMLSRLLGTNSENRLGFTMILDNDGNIAVRYNSGINERNPQVSQRSIPENQRQLILNTIMKVTGTKAYSDEH